MIAATSLSRIHGRFCVSAMTPIVAILLSCVDGPASMSAAGLDHVNVVVFLADDQGWGDLSLHGNPNLATPNIDGLAKSGVRLNHFYVCPVCSPTRAEFLTGRYHPRSGVQGVTRGGERMNADEVTIADVFRKAGYATAAYGKWHNGMQWPYHPNARGFDDYYGFCSGHWANYFAPMLEHNGAITTGNGFLVDDLTDHAIKFIESHQDSPFFVYLPYNTPHSPMQVPDEFYDRFAGKSIERDSNPENAKREDPSFTRAALAMCENIDFNVGRVLQTLQRLDLTQDTIVVYFSDNGPNSYRFNAGMRGRKGSTFEGGVRSPCVMRFPAKIGGGQTFDQVTGAVDLLPTLADLAGLDWAPTKPLDGLSLAGLLTNSGDFHGENRILITHWSSKISARTDGYRYHHDGKLYDLNADPAESTNVAKRFPKITKRLADAVASYRAETNPRKSNAPDARPFVLGHPEARWTQIPARDGNTSGDVKRNNRHANCTFFENWRSPDDKIFWNVDVAEAGEFAVTMYYAIDSDQVGSKVRMRCGDATLDAVIDGANQTPLFGEKQDRHPRIEGYTKRWKPMSLGTVRLEKGPAELSLQATEIVADEVAQMRLLMFERIQR